MPLFNVILFWIFFGFLSSHLAKRRGRNPVVWFSIGICLGILSVILLLVMPRPKPKQRNIVNVRAEPVVTTLEPQEDFWYYLDSARTQMGPFTLLELHKAIDEGKLTPDTYVWKAGFADWMLLSSVPELIKKFSLLETSA